MRVFSPCRRRRASPRPLPVQDDGRAPREVGHRGVHLGAARDDGAQPRGGLAVLLLQLRVGQDLDVVEGDEVRPLVAQLLHPGHHEGLGRVEPPLLELEGEGEQRHAAAHVTGEQIAEQVAGLVAHLLLDAAGRRSRSRFRGGLGLGGGRRSRSLGGRGRGGGGREPGRRGRGCRRRPRGQVLRRRPRAWRGGGGPASRRREPTPRRGLPARPPGREQVPAQRPGRLRRGLPGPPGRGRERRGRRAGPGTSDA